MQPDSIVPQPGNPQSLNGYSYGLNNPFRYTDPTGHDPLDAEWQSDFSAAHNRGPDPLDEAIRLFSLAYQDEWFGNELWNVFYNADGTANRAAVFNWFQNAPAARTWDTMGSALVSLSGFYAANEEAMFVRDVGFLYAGMPSRSQSTGLQPYWSSGGFPGNEALYIQGGSINPMFTNTTTNDQNDPDANVHHWAWTFNLGYNLPTPVGEFINAQHEWRQGKGLLPWSRRSDLSDLAIGGAGIQMGRALSANEVGYAHLPGLFRRWLGVGP